MVDSYKPSQVNQFSARLNEILQSPDKGQVLYRYRIDGDEFEQLQKYLIGFNAFFYNPDLILKYSCPLDMYFVLYASEWWRRCYEGEWSWKGILTSIGLDPKEISSQTLVSIVEKGLKKWQRAIFRNESGHRYALGSIAREGGLPIFHLNQTEGGWLERLLKPALAHKIRTEDSRFYIESNQNIIPKSYGRDQVIETLVDLIDDIYQLIQLYQLDKKDHPISFLNDNVPQWEERFPFPLDAAPAQDMLRDLIVESIKQKRIKPIEDQYQDDWQDIIQLKRLIAVDRQQQRVTLSASITAPAAILLGADNINCIDDDNLVVEFSGSEEAGHQGQWLCYPAYSQKRLKLERRTSISLAEKNWQTDIVMQIRNSVGKLVKGLTDRQNNNINPYQNASMYAVDINAPFMAQITDSKSFLEHSQDIETPIIASYIGSHSQHCSDECALVYIPDACQYSPESTSEIVAISPLLAGKLYLLAGTVLVISDDTQYKLKTNSKDVNYNYEIIGRQLTDFVYPSLTIKGSFKVKQINKADPSEWQEVSKSRIRLTAIGNSKASQPLSNYPISSLMGCFRLQVIDQHSDTIVFQQTIGLVPNDFKYRLIALSNTADNYHGQIDIQTQHPVRLDVGQHYNECIQVDAPISQDNTFTLTTTQVPLQKIILEMRFLRAHPTESRVNTVADITPMRFGCFFPSSQATIYDNEGKSYNRSLHLNINQALYGYRIKVFNGQKNRTARLEFSLQSQPDNQIIKQIYIDANKFLELEPYQWVGTIQKILSFSQLGLDDEVTVKLYLMGREQFSMTFNYYDYQLQRNFGERTIQLTTTSQFSKSHYWENPELYDCYQNIQLRAINFLHPDHSGKLLTKAATEAEYSWTIDAIKKEAGTWLIYAEPVSECITVTDEAQASIESTPIERYVSEQHTPQIRSTVWSIDKRVEDTSSITYAKKSEDYAIIPESCSEQSISSALINEQLDLFSGIQLNTLSSNQLDLFSSSMNDESNTIVLNPIKQPQYSLKSASTIVDAKNRQAVLMQTLSAMAYSPEHPDWQYMQDLSRACIGIPLVTLDNWQVAKQVPEFMCAVMIYGDILLGKDIVQKVSDEIGFVWEFVSVDSFERIWHQYHQWIQQVEKSTGSETYYTTTPALLPAKEANLQEVSPIFTYLFSCLEDDAQSYNQQIVQMLLDGPLDALIKQKQSQHAVWPEPNALSPLLDRLYNRIDTHCQLSLPILELHSYMKPTIQLPFVMAWLSCQIEDSDPDTPQPLIAYRQHLYSESLSIYHIKQFAPNWYQEAYSLLLGWFRYCKVKQR